MKITASWTHEGFKLMDGSIDSSAANTSSFYVEARLDLVKKKATLEKVPELGVAEFLQTDVRQNLTEHRYTLMLAQPGNRETFGFSRLVLIDRVSGEVDAFDPSPLELLEEHLIVPKPGTHNEFWIVGTSLDWKKGGDQSGCL